MAFSDTLINTSLLGTGKKQPDFANIPDALKNSLEKIKNAAPDVETSFLMVTSLALGYEKTGSLPVKIPIEPEEAANETLPHCSSEAQSILKDLLQYKYPTLVWFWCKQCIRKQQIAPPSLLPQLFEWGTLNKKQWKDTFIRVIGERGLWLSKFSSEWSFVSEAHPETDWETGILSQRIAFLRELRTTNPKEALMKIQSVWKEENASNRYDLLDALSIHLSKSDELFLAQIMLEKSSKVKEKAWGFLKLIPDSEVLILFQEVLANSIVYSQSQMLGFIKKSSLSVSLHTNEKIYQYGIQELSSDKNTSDHDYVLNQLIAEVPPAFWEKHFNCSRSDVVKIFATKDELLKFRPSLCQAVVKFKDAEWSHEIAEQFVGFPLQILSFIGFEKQLAHAEKFLASNPMEVINLLKNEELIEWNLSFTRSLLKLAMENPYQFTRNFFESVSMYLPTSILKEIDQYMPTDEWKKNTWVKTVQEIKEYIQIKEKIKNILTP